MAVPAPVQSMLAGHLAEVTWIPLPDRNGAISDDAANIFLDNLGRTTVVLLGPGLGQNESTRQFIKHLLTDPTIKERALPLVLDADGLRMVAQFPNWPTLLPENTILTPHPGEMSALSGIPIDAIQQDRLSLARRFSQSWGHVLVLKGALTVVASPDGRACIIPVATPALAHAGTGDVLAGMIAGLRAQKCSAFEAAWAGAYLHGQAGLLANRMIGNPASVLAGDVISQIAGAINAVLE